MVRAREERGSKKNPGIELLSHTQLCSTIVAELLIDRVRDGNVSFKLAIDTGKKYVLKMLGDRGDKRNAERNERKTRLFLQY